MKFLVVGLGSMGKRRIRNLRRLGQANIIGADPQLERRQEAEKLFGIPTCLSFEDGLALGADALIISTPPDMHMGFAKSAVMNGKHFFCEASTSADGMAEVQRIAQANKVVAAPSCTMRHHPSVRRLKEIVAAGGIGTVLTYTHHAGQWLPDWHPAEDYRKFYVSRRATGACREIVPFELTWLNWVIDAKVKHVTAMKAKLSDLDCDIDDVYQLLMQYDNGAIGHLQIDVLARAPVRYCRIIGTEGTLECCLIKRNVRHYRAASGEWTSYAEPPARVEPGYSEMSNEAMYEDEIAAYIAAIRGDAPWSNSLEDDTGVLAILTAAESATEHGVIQSP
jgi:predicted dehydrogenase